MGKMQTRRIQKKANNFISTLENKSEIEIKQMYLDNKEWWQEIISGEYQEYYKKMYENR